ncbi:MAG: hypothetical protein MJ213_01835 [Bacilli bacterium]|nr:hypothetical protein [Bacilli bacterium]
MPQQSKKKFDPKRVDHLKMGIILVKKGHGVAINNLLFDHGVAMSLLLYAEGARQKYVADILGGEEQRIEAIIAIMNEKKIKEIKSVLQMRFDISKDSVGAMLVFDIKSMAGILAYKYLADFGGASKNGNK